MCVWGGGGRAFTVGGQLGRRPSRWAPPGGRAGRRFLSNPDSVLRCEGMHARWKWIETGRAALKFKMLNAILKLQSWLHNNNDAFPDAAELIPFIREAQAERVYRVEQLRAEGLPNGQPNRRPPPPTHTHHTPHTHTVSPTADRPRPGPAPLPPPGRDGLRSSPAAMRPKRSGFPLTEARGFSPAPPPLRRRERQRRVLRGALQPAPGGLAAGCQ